MHKDLWWWRVGIIGKWWDWVRRRRIVTVDGFAYRENGGLELGRRDRRWMRGKSRVNSSTVRTTIVTPRITIRTTSPSPIVASSVKRPIASPPLSVIGVRAIPASIPVLPRRSGIRCGIGKGIRARSKAVSIISYFERINFVRVGVAWQRHIVGKCTA